MRRWTVSKTSLRVAARAVCRAPASTGLLGDAGQLQAGPGQRQRADLLRDQVAQPGAAGGQHAAGEHDQRRVDHRDHGGDAQCEALRERGQQLVARPGCRRVPWRRRPAGVLARSPSERARASTERPPASSWKPPALPRRTSRTSGVPGSGRKPTSPAPPVAPPWTRPSMTTAAPIPSSAHSRTKSCTPRASPARISAIAARLTSLSTSSGVPTASVSRSSRCGSCQPGRCRA